MRSRYLEIALTYTRPWPLRFWAVLATVALAWIAGLLVFGTPSSVAQMSMLLMGGLVAAWIGAMIAAHAKEQLADPRAALTPNFRQPHLVVSAIMFLVFAVALPLALAAAQEPMDWGLIWPPGYVAMVLVITSLLAWMGHLQSPKMFIVMVFIISPVCFAKGRAVLNDVVHGSAPGLEYTLLAVAIASLVALWWRLGLMHAEMPEYSRTMGPGLRLRVQMTGDPVFRRENAAGAGPLESWIRHNNRLYNIDNISAAGFWQRVRLWLVFIGLGRMPIFVALSLGLWCFVLPQIAGGRLDKASAVVLPITISLMVPGAMVAAVWPRRWYVIAGESLRPVSRRQFVREQGAAMALEMAMTWLAITIVTFAGGLLLSPSNILASSLWRALPMLAAGQVITFSVIVWVLRYRNGWMVVVPMFVAMVVSSCVLVLGGVLAQLQTSGPMLFAAVAVALLGAGISFDAYRRWLTTEFD
jgi:hypothetical protein